MINDLNKNINIVDLILQSKIENSKTDNVDELQIGKTQSIKLKPNTVGANYNLGTTLYNLGLMKEAEIYTRKEIEINPRSWKPTATLLP